MLHQKVYEAQRSQIRIGKTRHVYAQQSQTVLKYTNSHIKGKKKKTEHDSCATPKGVWFTTILHEK